MIQHSQPIPTMLEFLESTYLLDRALQADSAQSFTRSCRQFAEYLGGDRPVDKITDAEVSGWVQAMEAAGYAPRSIKGKRGDVLCLLEYAAAYDLRPEPKVKRIRKVKVPQPIPTAWTIAEFNRIIDAAASLKGCMLDGVPRRDYWIALLATAYDTGLRRTDVMGLQASDIDGEGKIWLTQHKTGAAICRRLRSSTLTAIQHLAGLKGDHVFRIPGRRGEEGHRNQIAKWWPKIRKLAEVADDRAAFHQVRRTGASYVEREQPGAARAYLGHLSPDMQKYYLDQRIAGSNPVMPPDVATFEETERRYPPDAPTLTALLEQYLGARKLKRRPAKEVALAVKRFIAFRECDPTVDVITHEQIVSFGESYGNVLSDRKIQQQCYLVRQLIRFATWTFAARLL